MHRMDAAQRRYVLFDFDGVIADSFHVAYRVVQKKCAHVSEADYRRAFEGNINDWEESLRMQEHGPECQHDLPWFDHFTPLFQDEVLPFPGMDEVLRGLREKYVLIIISSTLTSPIQGFMEKFHLGRYIAEVMGNDVHRHKTEKIRMVLEKYGTTPERCVFVTDSVGDMREAAAMQVGAIGVTWGWHTREALGKGAPYRIVDTPAEITAAVTDYFDAPRRV